MIDTEVCRCEGQLKLTVPLSLSHLFTGSLRLTVHLFSPLTIHFWLYFFYALLFMSLFLCPTLSTSSLGGLSHQGLGGLKSFPFYYPSLSFNLFLFLSICIQQQPSSLHVHHPRTTRDYTGHSYGHKDLCICQSQNIMLLQNIEHKCNCLSPED